MNSPSAPDASVRRAIAERLERLITIDVSARGVIDILYEAARAERSGPLLDFAASLLLPRLRPGATLFILTGYPTKTWFTPGLTECDGPVGAASLGRMLHLACGTTPIFLVESRLARFMVAAARAAGFIVAPEPALLAREARPAPVRAAAVLPFPLEVSEAEREADRLLAAHDPAAIVAIEMPGLGRSGAFHTSTGLGVPSELVPRFEVLLRAAAARGVPSVGIADGGAEIGMGRIEQAIRERVPFGAKCRCPCGDGMASHVPTDALVLATISNWGGHALGMLVSAAVGRTDGLHDGALEMDMIRACVHEGAVDGMAPGVGLSVDGLDATGNAAMADLLRRTVTSVLERVPRD